MLPKVTMQSVKGLSSAVVENRIRHFSTVADSAITDPAQRAELYEWMESFLRHYLVRAMDDAVDGRPYSQWNPGQLFTDPGPDGGLSPYAASLIDPAIRRLIPQLSAMGKQSESDWNACLNHMAEELNQVASIGQTCRTDDPSPENHARIEQMIHHHHAFGGISALLLLPEKRYAGVLRGDALKDAITLERLNPTGGRLLQSADDNFDLFDDWQTEQRLGNVSPNRLLYEIRRGAASTGTTESRVMGAVAAAVLHVPQRQDGAVKYRDIMNTLPDGPEKQVFVNMAERYELPYLNGHFASGTLNRNQARTI